MLDIETSQFLSLWILHLMIERFWNGKSCSVCSLCWLATQSWFISLNPLSVRSSEMAELWCSSIWLNERDRFLRLTELQRRLLLFMVGVCGCCCEPYDSCISSSYEKLAVSFDSVERSSFKRNDFRLHELLQLTALSVDISNDFHWHIDERSGVLRINDNASSFFRDDGKLFGLDCGVVDFDMGEIQPNDSRPTEPNETSSGGWFSSWVKRRARILQSSCQNDKQTKLYKKSILFVQKLNHIIVMRIA